MATNCDGVFTPKVSGVSCTDGDTKPIFTYFKKLHHIYLGTRTSPVLFQLDSNLSRPLKEPAHPTGSIHHTCGASLQEAQRGRREAVCWMFASLVRSEC